VVLIYPALLNLLQQVNWVNNLNDPKHKAILSVLVPSRLQMRAVVRIGAQVSYMLAPPLRYACGASNVKLGVLDVNDFVNDCFTCVVHISS
jgi:hypothetical protein